LEEFMVRRLEPVMFYFRTHAGTVSNIQTNLFNPEPYTLTVGGAPGATAWILLIAAALCTRRASQAFIVANCPDRVGFAEHTVRVASWLVVRAQLKSSLGTPWWRFNFHVRLLW